MSRYENCLPNCQIIQVRSLYKLPRCFPVFSHMYIQVPHLSTVRCRYLAARRPEKFYWPSIGFRFPLCRPPQSCHRKRRRRRSRKRGEQDSVTLGVPNLAGRARLPFRSLPPTCLPHPSTSLPTYLTLPANHPHALPNFMFPISV